MEVSTTHLEGVLLCTPTLHTDKRGFSHTFDREEVAGVGVDPDRFTRDSLSRSRRGRGGRKPSHEAAARLGRESCVRTGWFQAADPAAQSVTINSDKNRAAKSLAYLGS